jgi:hypothetical protein
MLLDALAPGNLHELREHVVQHVHRNIGLVPFGIQNLFSRKDKCVPFDAINLPFKQLR